MRVIRSTVRTVDVNGSQQAAICEAVDRALTSRCTVRETHWLDKGQKAHKVTLLPYTGPDRTDRWAVLHTTETDVEWVDTDDPTKADALYIQWLHGELGSPLPS
ncbi:MULTISPECIES: hypothetical protein [unclassified Streptomyces]|uniref:hypothetical protein n=1 Tax=unclassified Streptomyces TaxID=2593676 RepID=UPI0033A1B5F0